MKPSADSMFFFVINPYECLGEHQRGTFWADFTTVNTAF